MMTDNPFDKFTLDTTDKIDFSYSGDGENSITPMQSSTNAKTDDLMPPSPDILPILDPINEINKVYCMDCVSGMKRMPSNFIDCTITDPPYEVNYMAKIKMMRDMDHGTHKHDEHGFTVDSDEHNETIDWEAWAKELYRIMKDDTHLYVFWAEKQSHKLVPILEKVGFKFCQYLVWVKNRPSMDATWGHKYAYQHELCGFFQKGWRKLNRENSLRTVLRYNIMGDQQNYKHPTQKPVKIIREFVTNSTNQGDLVFDGFMGSGTTAVASKQLKRNFMGFEITPHYANVVIKERLEQEQMERWFE